MHVVHKRFQHGVGQGSFHSAKIKVTAAGKQDYRFDYVYDCGAVAHIDKTALRQRIDSLRLRPRAYSTNKGVINALVLSHFDQDHIVGAKHLIRQYNVGRIFLPYLSPQEWMLVLASQADRWRAVQIRALHALATGATDQFFGVPATMVDPTGDQDNDGGPPADQPSPSGDEPVSAEGRKVSTPSFPRDLQAVVGPKGAALGLRLPPGADVTLRLPGSPSPKIAWLLRFWNRGVSHALLHRLEQNLATCGFPLAGLNKPSGVHAVLNWLDLKSRRDQTLDAYLDAVNATQPAGAGLLSSKHIANYISMGLYSGPAGTFIPFTASYGVGQWRETAGGNYFWSGYSASRTLPHSGSQDRPGWLGTGDAPLGELGVWTDFARRYRRQLDQAITVQVPHHEQHQKAERSSSTPACCR